MESQLFWKYILGSDVGWIQVSRQCISLTEPKPRIQNMNILQIQELQLVLWQLRNNASRSISSSLVSLPTIQLNRQTQFARSVHWSMSLLTARRFPVFELAPGQSQAILNLSDAPAVDPFLSLLTVRRLAGDLTFLLLLNSSESDQYFWRGSGLNKESNCQLSITAGKVRGRSRLTKF